MVCTTIRVVLTIPLVPTTALVKIAFYLATTTKIFLAKLTQLKIRLLSLSIFGSEVKKSTINTVGTHTFFSLLFSHSYLIGLVSLAFSARFYGSMHKNSDLKSVLEKLDLLKKP